MDIPEGAKKPQDHKQATAKKSTSEFRLSPEYELREVDGWDIDHDGIVLFMPEESLGDFHIQDHMAKIKSDGRAESWRYPLILERLLGSEQRDQLLKHVTDPATGRADNERVGEFIKAAFEVAVPNG